MGFTSLKINKFWDVIFLLSGWRCPCIVSLITIFGNCYYHSSIWSLNVLSDVVINGMNTKNKKLMMHVWERGSLLKFQKVYFKFTHTFRSSQQGDSRVSLQVRHWCSLATDAGPVLPRVHGFISYRMLTGMFPLRNCVVFAQVRSWTNLLRRFNELPWVWNSPRYSIKEQNRKVLFLLTVWAHDIDSELALPTGWLLSRFQDSNDHWSNLINLDCLTVTATCTFKMFLFFHPTWVWHSCVG